MKHIKRLLYGLLGLLTILVAAGVVIGYVITMGGFMGIVPQVIVIAATVIISAYALGQAMEG